MKAVYIHIPFCTQICNYCDFNKVFLKNQPVSEYLEALDQEMANVFRKFPFETIETVFIGGGTPSALSSEHLHQLMKIIQTHIPLDQVKEYTVEANPGEINKDKLRLLKAGGVNRLSFGVQAFQDDLLMLLGRGHRKKEVFQTMDDVVSVGFKNVSIDLMFGLPKQTLEMFQESLSLAFTLPITHLSCYSLQIEPKTYFYVLDQKGQLPKPTDEQEATMYDYLLEETKKQHFNQYEISNFAKPGYESNHNLTYWNNDEYYGIGAGAHSYMNGVRRSNIGVIKRYMTNIKTNQTAYLDEITLTQKEKMEEFMFMGLRKTNGISKREFLKRYGVNVTDYFSQAMQVCKDNDWLIEEGDFIKLSPKGLFLGNYVFQEFIGA